MNDLLERYLKAVSSYFIGKKRIQVYTDLKNQIQSVATNYDDLEQTLLNYGSPRSLALSYGYRPFVQHIYNPKLVYLIEKIVFIVSGIYLFFSTLYYLYQLNCLPFQSTQQVASTLNTSTVITWLLSYPFFVMGFIVIVAIIALVVLDSRYPVPPEDYASWSIDKLNALPHQTHYPSHIAETLFMIIFTIFFTIYAYVFSSDIIMKVQHESFQMIHLMTYFFQPFIMIIYVDYIIDITKKYYTRKFLKYSTSINLFILLSILTFIFKSDFLKNYILPASPDISYTLINTFIVSALIMISSISLYKLLRNLRSYLFLFRNKN